MSGRKILTARMKPYGRAGDVLATPFGVSVRLVDVRQVRLEDVASRWAEEGAESRRDFIATWERIYPEAPFAANPVVWLHLFRVVKNESVNA